MYKVVFHVTEKNKWGMVLSNAQNVKNAMPETDIIVISVGEAILSYTKDSDIKEELKAASELGIGFIGCNNSLNARGLSPEELLDFIEVVPAGMVEMIKRQSDGYIYIRP